MLSEATVSTEYRQPQKKLSLIHFNKLFQQSVLGIDIHQ